MKAGNFTGNLDKAGFWKSLLISCNSIFVQPALFVIREADVLWERFLVTMLLGDGWLTERATGSVWLGVFHYTGVSSWHRLQQGIMGHGLRRTVNCGSLGTLNQHSLPWTSHYSRPTVDRPSNHRNHTYNRKSHDHQNYTHGFPGNSLNYYCIQSCIQSSWDGMTGASWDCDNYVFNA